MSEASISLEEWIAEISRLSERDQGEGGFKTAREWAEECDTSYTKILKLLREVAVCGRLETRRVKRHGIDGGVQYVPAYKIAGDPGKKKKKRRGGTTK